MRVKTGIEAEFFLLTPDGEQISDPYRYRRQALL